MELKRGDKSPQVIELQKLLNQKGFFNAEYIQNFGPKTEAAVKAYQASINFDTTGIVTLSLWNTLQPKGEKTLNIEVLKRSLNDKGYVWYNDRPNIIGIRTTMSVPDVFNDLLCVIYLEKGVEILKMYTVTSDPGTYWLLHPMNKLGTAVLKPGQYINSHSIGFHQNKQDHKALVQTGKVTVYRDNDKDNQAEAVKTEEVGLFGINIHGANKNTKTMSIGKWSAGCQVFQTWSQKEELLTICEKFKKITNNKFTYTLLLESDLKF
jgi:hypothetical protein